MQNFEGTILSGSYNPAFFENEDVDFEYDNDSRKWVATSIPNVGKYIQPFTVQLGYQLFEKGSIEAKSLLESLWDFVKLISKTTARREMEQKFNTFVADAKKSYYEYSTNHESTLQKMTKSVEKINIKKVLMKDLLKTLHSKLQRMGINSNYTEVKLENLDLRKFPLNEDYNIIQKKQLEFISSSDDAYLLWNPANFVGIFIFNIFKIRQIQKKMAELEVIQKDLQASMASDLKKLSLTFAALENVANIYSAIHDQLRPVFESLLDQLTHRYSNDLGNMPQEKVASMQKIKDLFKKISEAVVIPQSNSKQMQDSVVKYSNNLSKQYNELRTEISHLAA